MAKLRHGVIASCPAACSTPPAQQKDDSLCRDKYTSESRSCCGRQPGVLGKLSLVRVDEIEKADQRADKDDETDDVAADGEALACRQTAGGDDGTHDESASGNRKSEHQDKRE